MVEKLSTSYGKELKGFSPEFLSELEVEDNTTLHSFPTVEALAGKTQKGKFILKGNLPQFENLIKQYSQSEKLNLFN